MNTGKVSNARTEGIPFFLELRGVHVGRIANGRLTDGRGPLRTLNAELILELAPLAAEFGLMGGTPGDRLRIIADQRQLADFETLG